MAEAPVERKPPNVRGAEHLRDGAIDERAGGRRRGNGHGCDRASRAVDRRSHGIRESFPRVGRRGLGFEARAMTDEDASYLRAALTRAR